MQTKAWQAIAAEADMLARPEKYDLRRGWCQHHDIMTFMASFETHPPSVMLRFITVTLMLMSFYNL